LEKPLSDIKVLDMTHVWFGPWSTMMLAALGAEVIKVEPPWGGLGRIPQRGDMYGGASSTYHHLNVNKKAMAINLKTEEGLNLFKELVKISDVVVQNFAPGTMEKMGIGYDTLKELNPKIIYAALSGFGQTGPYSERAAYAVIAEALAGQTMSQGASVDPEGPPKSMIGAFGDLAPGTMAAMSIIAAIRYRDKTGIGQMIDVAQADCMFAYNTGTTSYLLTGKDEVTRRKEQDERRKTTGGGMMRIGGILEVKGGYIHLAGWRPKGIEKLKKIMGVEEIDPEAVKELIKTMDKYEAANFFADVGLPVSPILWGSEACENEHILARNMIVEIEHPTMGKYKAVNFPVKFSETPITVETHAPLLGEHNEQVLVDYLGYTPEKVDELLKKGIIAKM